MPKDDEFIRVLRERVAEKEQILKVLSESNKISSPIIRRLNDELKPAQKYLEAWDNGSLSTDESSS